MTKLKKHWRRWVLVGILMDCVVLLFSNRIFGASNVTISTAESLERLDGSSLDADGRVNGIFTVGGNLTLAPGGRITCGSSSGGPCAVRLAVGGNLEMRPASAILSGQAAGTGGPIEIAVGGNFTMRGPSGLQPGAKIRASDSDASSGGAIEIYAVGQVTTEPGSAIVSDAAAEGGEIAITAAATAIRGALSTRATTAAGRPGAIALASPGDASSASDSRHRS
jgi:hypothetical protein